MKMNIMALAVGATASITIAAATPENTRAAECTALKPQISQGTGQTIQTTIAPSLGFNSHGNTFFFVDRPIKNITIILTPLSMDTGIYPTQLVSRYNDDSIFESGAPIFTPNSLSPITWGPLMVNQPGKNLTAFNVKILENFHLYPSAKGFTYKLEAIGCQ